MSLDLAALEKRVYTLLDENEGVGLQPEDAQEIVDTVEEEAISRRMQKLLEQLAENKPSRMDRMRITTSLLQLFEAQRRGTREDQDEQGAANELFDLAEQARTSNHSGETLIDEGVETLQDADDAAFDDAEITREDATQFLRDVREETDELNNPEDIIGDTLRSLGEALKKG